MVGIIYGDVASLNGHYRRITSEYDFPVYVGQGFWHRLTGDVNFYSDLIHAIGEVAIEADFSEEFEEVIHDLSNALEIKALSKNKQEN